MENNKELYAEIDELVFQYQGGSEDAGLKLIQLFGYDPETNETSWLIGKYFNLLRYGAIKFRNADTRSFIRLFSSDPLIKEGLSLPFQYADTKKEARKIVQRINNRMKHLTDKEIIHDLCSVLLDLASRYQKKGKGNKFLGYVRRSYHFYVFHHFKYLFTDLSYSHRIDPLEDHIDENSEITIQDSWYKDLYFDKEKDELGFNWILGRTADYPFDQLTQFERTLLHLYDFKGFTYEEVGAQMGYHRDTIWSKRKKIKEKLEMLMKNKPSDL